LSCISSDNTASYTNTTDEETSSDYTYENYYFLVEVETIRFFNFNLVYLNGFNICFLRFLDFDSSEFCSILNNFPFLPFDLCSFCSCCLNSYSFSLILCVLNSFGKSFSRSRCRSLLCRFFGSNSCVINILRSSWLPIIIDGVNVTFGIFFNDTRYTQTTIEIIGVILDNEIPIRRCCVSA
jgi:hypothetical protein